MKAYFYILIALVIFTVFMLFYGNGLAQTNVIVCDNYDSIYTVIKSGKTAEYNKTAWIEKHSLVEESTVNVFPDKSGQEYKVNLKIISLKKGVYSAEYDKNPVLGYITMDCNEFGKKYKSFNNTSCSFVTQNIDDVMEAAKYGISYKIDNNCSIQGNLTEVYKKMCVIESKPVPVKKPAVYLYPVTPVNVSVKVEVKGKLTHTDPDYGNGWSVFAETNGIINGKYDYLFYEADLNKIELPDEGWVVEYDKLEIWFDEYLPVLGLNQKETAQFKEYWLGKLKQANYYEIKILSDSFLEKNMRLVIDPEPETLIRLNFHFLPLSVKKEIKEPVIQNIERKGFTVVEWGGIDAGELMSAK